MFQKIRKKNRKNTVVLMSAVLFAVMAILQLHSQATTVQAATYDFGGTWKMTKKQSNGEKMRCMLEMGWYSDPVDAYEGYFNIEVEGLYGTHHMDNYAGSVKKIGTNKWQGKDEYIGATLTFKIKKNQIVVKVKGGNTQANWNDVPSGTFKLKKRLDYSQVG